MGASYGKGARGKATKLHSDYVRARAGWRCEHCGGGEGDLSPKGKPIKQVHCAHIITRHKPLTRTDENNAFCLCASCHFYFTKWPVEFAKFVFEKIGKRKYNALFKKATAEGKVDWVSEVERLQALIEGLES
jgi:hypothetical protein